MSYKCARCLQCEQYIVLDAFWNVWTRNLKETAASICRRGTTFVEGHGEMETIVGHKPDPNSIEERCD